MGFEKCMYSLFCFLAVNLNYASSSLLSSPVREYQTILDFKDHRLDLSMSSVSSCNVSCALNGSNAVFTWNHTSSDEFTIVKSNLCPNHIFQNSVGDNPNDACVQDEVQFYLPKQPYFISNSSGTNDAILTTMNPVGFTLSGVAIYGPAINSYGGDAVKHEIDTFDWCGGHADPNGIEHYHSEPYCVAEAARQHPEDGMVNPGNNHSVMYGWISDGFPIYGPHGDGGVVPADLDECQGHYGDSGAGGGYHYHYAGPTGAYQYDSYNGSGYPYFLACFKGCISSQTENSESIAQDDPYPVCKQSGTKAPAGNYSGQFFPTFTGLNYSFVEEQFVYADTDAPTVAPTSAPTLGCSMYVTTTDSASDGWNGYIFALFAANDHSMSSPLQNITLSSGSSGETCLDVDADTCYKFGKYISGTKGLDIGWDICGYSGTVGTILSFCTDSDGLYGNCTARATSAATTASPTASPTSSTVSPTASPTTVSPTASPTAFPTVSPSASPTASPTVSPTASPTASPSVSPTASPTVPPSVSPTASPTAFPTVSPTSPTMSPTASPTASPSVSPTASPTAFPTVSPTASPTTSPTLALTQNPTAGKYICDFTIFMMGANKTTFTDERLGGLEKDMATAFEVHPSQVAIGASSHFPGMPPPPQDAGLSSTDRRLSNSLTNSSLNCTVNGLSDSEVNFIFTTVTSMMSNGTFDSMLAANGIPPPLEIGVATFSTISSVTDTTDSTSEDSSSEDVIAGAQALGTVVHTVILMMGVCFVMIK